MQELRRHLINSAPLISYLTEPGKGKEGDGGCASAESVDAYSCLYSAGLKNRDNVVSKMDARNKLNYKTNLVNDYYY